MVPENIIGGTNDVQRKTENDDESLISVFGCRNEYKHFGHAGMRVGSRQYFRTKRIRFGTGRDRREEC